MTVGACGDSYVLDEHWYRLKGSALFWLLCRQRYRPNVSWHDACHPGGRMARLQPHVSR